MKTSLVHALCLAFLALGLQACSSDAASDIVDVGKSCSAERDCEHVCVVERGQATGQCSLECEDNSDCPSFMDCLTSSSTGERRCFDPGGLVVTPIAVACSEACSDVNYFCSTDAITDEHEVACKSWCGRSPDAERRQFIDCVNASERYKSACPATECMP